MLITAVATTFILFTSYQMPASYSKLLGRVATENGVTWNRFGAAEKKSLQESLDWLAAFKVETIADPKEELSFWINAHNICVMKLVSDRLPISDVMAIDGFRDNLSCNIAGKERTLNDLESGIIRPKFKNPLTLFALWWGAQGSPRLRPEPYAATTLDAQLQDQAKKSLVRDKFVQFESSLEVGEAPLVKKTDGTKPNVTLSPLFDWYKYDFGRTENEVLEFLRKNLPQEASSKLPKKITQVAFAPFDWSLDQPAGN